MQRLSDWQSHAAESILRPQRCSYCCIIAACPETVELSLQNLQANAGGALCSHQQFSITTYRLTIENVLIDSKESLFWPSALELAVSSKACLNG